MDTPISILLDNIEVRGEITYRSPHDLMVWSHIHLKVWKQDCISNYSVLYFERQMPIHLVQVLLGHKDVLRIKDKKLAAEIRNRVFGRK